MYVKVTYRAKFGVQIWSGSVFICTAIFVNVLPPLLDSKNDREQYLKELGRDVGNFQPPYASIAPVFRYLYNFEHKQKIYVKKTRKQQQKIFVVVAL